MYKTLLPIVLLGLTACGQSEPESPSPNRYDQLVDFFHEWRTFQTPVDTIGIPDYSADAMQAQHRELRQWQVRLASFDTTGWPISQQVDWYLVWAEMNGLDFDHRVVRPWERDPAFYVWFYPGATDVPEREGPNIHGAIELPRYELPLSDEDAAAIARQMRKAPQVFAQARQNLTGTGRDLWLSGTRSIREQSTALGRFRSRVEDRHPDLAAATQTAIMASDELAEWLVAQAGEKSGASGTGKENYTWNLRNVHLLPYSWEDEKVLMERELARAHASLRLEEHRNRALPGHTRIGSSEEYDRRLGEAVDQYMAFLEEEEILPIKEYMDVALRERVGSFSPVREGELRGFFDEITYRDPIVMRTHHYHWFELARMREEPVQSPIRRNPGLYNLWDARAEGMATGMEEMMMHAGLFDDKPRARELVWVLLAQRAARGLGALYQHGLEMSLDEAAQYASKWTPWGLLPADGATIQHEEQFYLQQPAYGTSYVIGKIEIEKLLAEYARRREGTFVLSEFMDEFNRAGFIPVSLLYWETTGDKSMLEAAIHP